jgi:uncharacterized Zn finger protein
MGYYEFPPYVPVSEKKKRAEKVIEKLKKKNPHIKPVVITGNKIAKTWWGIEWICNLERYADYSNRIGRGRSYVRNDAVLDLQIEAGKITALVQGSNIKPYAVIISIKTLPRDVWKHIISTCEGQLGSLSELVEGKFPKALAELFTARDKGLFPSPKQISFNCSCPDWAYMCKHVAAVLYGVGARLDEDPALFFVLRNIKVENLVSSAVSQKSEKLLQKAPIKSSRIMNDRDISAVFGIECSYGLEEKKRKKKTPNTPD